MRHASISRTHRIALLVLTLVPGYLSPDLTAIAAPKGEVTWSPAALNVTVVQGTAKQINLQLTSTAGLTPGLFVTPEIAPFLVTRLPGGAEIKPSQIRQVAASIAAPADSRVGTYEGTVHVRQGNRTIPATLKVSIHIVAGSAEVVPEEVASPTPDRVVTTDTGFRVVVDELDVILKQDVSDQRELIARIAADTGGVVIGSIPGLSIYQLRFPGQTPDTLEGIASYIETLAGVESVSLNILGTVHVSPPNDPLFAEDWDTNIADGLNRHLEFARAPSAWELTTGNSSIRAAVIDARFDWLHPDLLPNIVVRGSDMPPWFTYKVPAADLGTGHGTITAGTLCARGNNSLGVTGFAWRCSLDVYDAEDSSTRGSAKRPEIDNNVAISAMKNAVDNGARVVNLSFGNTCADVTVSCLERLEKLAKKYAKAIRYSIDHRTNNQVLWIFAAGNEAVDAGLSLSGILEAQFPERVVVVGAAEVPPATPVGVYVPGRGVRRIVGIGA